MPGPAGASSAATWHQPSPSRPPPPPHQLVLSGSGTASLSFPRPQGLRPSSSGARAPPSPQGATLGSEASRVGVTSELNESGPSRALASGLPLRGSVAAPPRCPRGQGPPIAGSSVARVPSVHPGTGHLAVREPRCWRGASGTSQAGPWGGGPRESGSPGHVTSAAKHPGTWAHRTRGRVLPDRGVTTHQPH